MNKETFLAGLGARVRHYRRRQGITLRELSARSGVSERFLSSLEAGRGNISVGRLCDVARALRVEVKDLLPDPCALGRPLVVSLLGLRGAGKSTVGPRLAARLEVPFLELDALVEAEAGLSLEEIFEFHGEAYYRRLELVALDHFLQRGESAVLATGGGIVTAPEAYALLIKETTTVWLEARPEDHWNRVLAQGDERPMADNPQAMAQMRSLMEQRAPLYARAEIRVPTWRKTPDAIADELAERVTAS